LPDQRNFASTGSKQFRDLATRYTLSAPRTTRSDLIVAAIVICAIGGHAGAAVWEVSAAGGMLSIIA
jgi:hypothetical protein